MTSNHLNHCNRNAIFFIATTPDYYKIFVPLDQRSLRSRFRFISTSCLRPLPPPTTSFLCLPLSPFRPTCRLKLAFSSRSSPVSPSRPLSLSSVPRLCPRLATSHYTLFVLPFVPHLFDSIRYTFLTCVGL